MKKEKVEKTDSKNKVTWKTYLRDFLVFVDKKLIKSIGILIIISILLVTISLGYLVDVARKAEYTVNSMENITIFVNYWNKLQVIIVILFSGIAPYLYAPIVGFIGSVLSEASMLAYIIKVDGYFVGICKDIIPLIINIVNISIITSVGIYICRAVTNKEKLSKINNMNFINFRIKLYGMICNEKKIKELTKVKAEKSKKLESNKEKLNYLQILNTTIFVCVLQFISVMIQQIII